MQKSIVGVNPETPKCTRTPIKSATRKKSSSQKALQGHKWFKGSPKSRSNQRMSKLLKSPQIEKTSTVQAIPSQEVEFDLGGDPDRLSVYQAIHVIEPETLLLETPKSKSKAFNAFDWKENEDTTVDSTPYTPLGSSKKGRTKEKSGKSGSVKSRVKVTGKQRNGKTKTPIDIEARKKSLTISKLPEASYRLITDYIEIEAPAKPNAYIRYMERPHEELADEVEYDLDEEDCAWLDLVNEKRKQQNLLPVKFEDMELLMDRLEKESYFQMQSTGIDQGALIDDDAVCCICMDGECQNSNAILFCDMCNLAVHQECYGVPYIPEGQWLCRRCLQSPSRAVDCALCPNKGGAFKQTDDGRWAHVVCAIWVPEVCFANTVFLEPVDSINNIPPARWRLVCYICKQKGVGACIQCHKSNCYTAFHVTCAQQAGLCMLMDTVRESTSITVKKTAYCDNHAPPESDFCKDVDGTPSPRQKMKQTRKILAEKRSAIPVLNVPTIPHDRIAEISSTVNFSRKNQFIKRLMAYWKLKRQSRNGVPLLRRLQAASSVPHPPSRDSHGASTDPNQKAQSQEHYRYWLRLRQDLERARLLCELVRKREKVKRELIYLRCRELELKLKPFVELLINVLDEISSRDPQKIFAEPVDINEVPDYLNFVTTPMDFSLMREKIISFEYNNIDEFEADFNLMIDNCLTYNAKDTVFYRTAIKLREHGGIIIRYARRSINSIGFDHKTGLLLPERISTPVVLTDDQILEKVENVLQDENRFDIPFDKQLENLHEVLDDTLGLSNPTIRKRKFNKIKQEIVRVRRLKRSQLNKLSPNSRIKKKYNTAARKNNNNNNSSLNKKNRSTSRDDYDNDNDDKEDDEEEEEETLEHMDISQDNSSAAESISSTPVKSLSKLRARSKLKTLGQPQPSSLKRALRPVSLKRKLSSSSPVSTKKSVSSTIDNSVEDTIDIDTIQTPPPKKGRKASTLSITSETPKKGANIVENCRWKKNLSFSSPKTKSAPVLEKSRLRERLQCDKAITPPPTGVGRRSASSFIKKDYYTTPTKNSSPNKNLKSSPKSTSTSPCVTNKRGRTKSIKSVEIEDDRDDDDDNNDHDHHQDESESSELNLTRKTTQKMNSLSSQSRRTPQTKLKDGPVPRNNNNNNSSVTNTRKQKHGTQKGILTTITTSTTTTKINSMSSTEKNSPTGMRKIQTRRTSIRSTKIQNETINSTSSLSTDNNNTTTMNNKDNWSPHNNVIPSSDIIKLKNIDSEPFSLPWTPRITNINNNTNSTSSSKRVGKKKINNSKNNTSNTSSVPTTNNNNNNNCMSNSYKKDSGVSSSTLPNNSSVLNNCNSPSKNNNNNSTTKTDSFMVYRLGRDQGMDSNSEEDNDNEDEKEEVDGESASDDDSSNNNSSSSGESDEDDEEDDGSHDLSSNEDESISVKNTRNVINNSKTKKNKIKPQKKKTSLTKINSNKNKNSVLSSNGSSNSDSEVSISDSENGSPVKNNSRSTNKNSTNKVQNVKNRQSKQQQLKNKQNDGSNDDAEEEEGLIKGNLNLMKMELKHFDSVWAKSKEEHWCPAVIFDPSMPMGNMHIPGPPSEMLSKKPNGNNESFLVLYFDTQRTWEWITRSNLKPLGIDPTTDGGHLRQEKVGMGKRALRRAYEKAILHRQGHQGTAKVPHMTRSRSSPVFVPPESSYNSSKIRTYQTIGKLKVSGKQSNRKSSLKNTNRGSHESKTCFNYSSTSMSSELVHERLPLAEKKGLKKCQYYCANEDSEKPQLVSLKKTSEVHGLSKTLLQNVNMESETHNNNRRISSRSVMTKKCPCCE